MFILLENEFKFTTDVTWLTFFDTIVTASKFTID